MKKISLQHRYWGEENGQPAILLLHGLLGSSRNWQGVGKQLGLSRNVAALDQRNHGASPHYPVMDYASLAGDALAWMDSQGIKRIHIVGHSMGGKVAMELACSAPERFTSLTVVDISPRAYPPRWEREFAAMQRMPVEHLTKRSEAEEWLESDIRDWAFRKFLVSNLERDPSGGFRWTVNLNTLHAALPNLFCQVPAEGQQFDGPTLFLRGGDSNFVTDEDLSLITGFFPQAHIKTVAAAGHNVHFDQPDAFVTAILDHVGKAES